MLNRLEAEVSVFVQNTEAFLVIFYVFSSACAGGLSHTDTVDLHPAPGKELSHLTRHTVYSKIFWECRWEEVVRESSLGFTHLLFKAVSCCVITQTRNQTHLESEGEVWSAALGWSIHPFRHGAFLRTSTTTVTYCGSGQLSLCPRTAKSHFTFPAQMTEMKHAWILSSENERNKEMQRSGVTHAHAAALLKSQLSVELQFLCVAGLRQLSSEWHVLHPPQFVHFHQPKIAHKASIFYWRFHFWCRLFSGLIRYCIRMIATGFLLGGKRKRETKGEKWRIRAQEREMKRVLEIQYVMRERMRRRTRRRRRFARMEGGGEGRAEGQQSQR